MISHFSRHCWEVKCHFFHLIGSLTSRFTYVKNEQTRMLNKILIIASLPVSKSNTFLAGEYQSSKVCLGLKYENNIDDYWARLLKRMSHRRLVVNIMRPSRLVISKYYKNKAGYLRQLLLSENTVQQSVLPFGL